MESTTSVPQGARPLSISRVRTFLTCGNAYSLLYRNGHLPRSSGSAWFGRLMHQVVRDLYRGSSLAEAYTTAWEHACGPLLPTLTQWLELDREYAGTGASTTKAARAWRESHADYDRLRQRIDAAQQTTFAHIRWGERTSLALCYRRAAALLSLSPEQFLLPYPILVEGRPVSDAPTRAEERKPGGGDELPEEDEKADAYSLLEGVLGQTPVVGVPDVIAEVVVEAEAPSAAEEGKGRVVGYRIGDYKFGFGRKATARQLAVDAQLLLYYHLALQNGAIDPGLPVEIGHLYPLEEGGEQVWADVSLYDEVLPLLEQQFAAVARQIEAGLFIPVHGIHAPSMSPCGTCDVAHVCRVMRS